MSVQLPARFFKVNGPNGGNLAALSFVTQGKFYMNKFISLLLMMFVLSGCSLLHVHKRDIEQGNVITDQEISALHKGMTSEQVRHVMGNPMLLNIFSHNRMEYVYTFQSGNEKMATRSVSCLFRGNILQEILIRQD